MYINDLPLSIFSSSVLLFADDTKCFNTRAGKMKNRNLVWSLSGKLDGKGYPVHSSQ